MIPYPNIGPDILHLGPLRVRWYGMMYVLGFIVGRQILRYLSRQKYLRLAAEKVDDYLITLFVGMLLGARLLYMLVYYESSLDAPFVWYITPFAVWEGGLAFHGGAIGMFLAMWLYARYQRVPYWNLADSLILAAPFGLFLGRIGNFINAELYGRPTDVPWAMQFPVRDFDGNVLGWTEPRHPSQLYEAFGEGLVTLALVWWLKRYIKHQGVLAGIGLGAYAVARFLVEFVREKDAQMPYYFGWMTMGQVLCAIMLAIAVTISIVGAWRRVPVPGPDQVLSDKS